MATDLSRVELPSDTDTTCFVISYPRHIMPGNSSRFDTVRDHPTTGELRDLGALSAHCMISRRPEAFGWGSVCEIGQPDSNRGISDDGIVRLTSPYRTWLGS